MQIDKQFHFLSGIGRSGSTVLAAILSQNPEIYATATSPLLDMLVFAEKAWREQVTQSRTHVAEGQLENIYKGIIQGTWAHVDKPVIIDKHRAWPRNKAGIVAMFGQASPKIICTVRDVASCVASFVSLIERHPGTVSTVDQILKQKGLPLTLENRCDCIWEDFLQNVYESLWIGWNECRSNLLLVEYDDMMADPEGQLDRIYGFLGRGRYAGHDLENIKNVASENDIFWGFQGLHDIRGKLQKTARPPEEIIGAENVARFARMEFWRGGDNEYRALPRPIAAGRQPVARGAGCDFWRKAEQRAA